MNDQAKAKAIADEEAAKQAAIELASKTSTGSTMVRIRIATGGNPVENMTVRIGYRGNIIAYGVTGENGVANMYTDDLISRNIDVYCSKGSDSWNIEGLITLDEGNYAYVDPANSLEMLNDKMKQFEDIDNMSDEEIMEGFGF